MATDNGQVKKTWNNFQSTKTPEPTLQADAPTETLDMRSNTVFTNNINLQQCIVTKIIGQLAAISNIGGK